MDLLFIKVFLFPMRFPLSLVLLGSRIQKFLKQYLYDFSTIIISNLNHICKRCITNVKKKNHDLSINEMKKINNFLDISAVSCKKRLPTFRKSISLLRDQVLIDIRPKD